MLDELRAELLRAAHSERDFSPEFGCLLLGTRLENLVRVLDWQTIQCSHSFGPRFVLNVAEEARLEAQIAAWQSSPDVNSLQVQGWLVSRHDGAEPSVEHRRLHARHFIDPGTLLLTCRPDLLGELDIRVATRFENEASLKLYPNPLIVETPKKREYSPEGEPGGPGQQPLRLTRRRRARSMPMQGLSIAGEHETDAGTVTEEGGPSEKMALWTMLCTVMLIAALSGALFHYNRATPWNSWLIQTNPLKSALSPASIGGPALSRQLLSLHAWPSGESLSLTWDIHSRAVFEAVGGEVVVDAGVRSRRFWLTERALSRGRFRLPDSLTPESVTLQIFDANGRQVAESIRFSTDPAEPDPAAGMDSREAGR